MIRSASAAVAIAVAAGAVELALRPLGFDASFCHVVELALCNVLVAVSLNVVNGMAGQLSIGHAGFVASGAYTAAIVASHLHASLGGGSVSFARSLVVVPAALVAAGVVSALFGLVVGVPSLRLRGDYLAVVTLAFAEIVRLSIASASGNGPLAGLGGPNGYAGIDGRGVPLYASPFWIVLVVGCAVACALRLKASAWGRSLRAVRDDETAAASVGIDPTRFKVGAFVVAAAGGGIAGGLLSLMRDGAPAVQPDAFGFAFSFDAVTMVILGGSGSVTGAALGAILVTLVVRAIELLERIPGLGVAGAELGALRMILYAAVIVAIMVLRPQGIFGEREPWRTRRA